MSFAMRLSGLRSLFGAAVPRASARRGGEHEMSLNRLVVGALLVAYCAFDADWRAFLPLAAAYAAGGALFAAHLAWRPEPSPTRQALARPLDIGFLSVALYAGGAATAVLYPLYLWIVFGNGFRFGLGALRDGAALGVLGFAATVVATPYWRDNPSLSAGLLIGLIALPAYAATLIRKLSRAKLAAEEASRAKSLFLASVSHELRTPLNAVIGMTDLLRDTTLDDEQRDMVRTAGDAGRSLLALIDDLLNFSRIEAGRMPSHVTAFDLHELLADVRGMLTAQAREKNIRLSLCVTPRTPYRLRGEARQIRDVLVNLVGNAVKFTETGGVVIGADLVGVENGRPRIRLQVADSGIGVAPEAQTRIFEAFSQADASIINRFGGTGLGLAICKQLVEMQGGELRLESEPGLGSTFWFDLLLEADETADAASEAATPVVALGADAARAEALAKALESEGVPATAAVGLRAALRAARAERRAIVADAEGFGMDGEALAAALRAAADSDAPELALIDPRLDEGLPYFDLSLVCASASPKRERLRAMARVAALGVVGRGAREKERRSDAPQAESRRLSILVAEDNRTNQKVIRKVLERAGHDVRMVENGEFALDALTERRFDLVLMDVNMPVLDGIECVKLYRFAAIGQPHVPILALTADATPDARRRCEEAGMDGCLTKPIEPERLLEIIDRMVAGAPPKTDAAASPASAEPEVADSVVANIARHPNFRPARRAVVDRATLKDLEGLGGHAFVADLVDAFLADTAVILGGLHDAVVNREAGVFRDQAHALRSGAANIGARGMYELCLSFRNMDARDLADDGLERLSRLEAEFDRVRATLRAEFPEGQAGRSAD
ncbi:two-component system sensor histidine kinase RpfC [Methylopila jiangsuensis]|nr:response regulator [Methylopila jiangsuensis]MDR6287091.1 two-component system sensor histidine kinase RpfC [Methylopila jiangsuensis]